MDRIFTVFVSSTKADLLEERLRVSEELIRRHRLPMGMESFASTGDSQWPMIRESMTASDICVLILGNRFGTVADESGQSWTQKEYRLAKDLGKKIVVLVFDEARAGQDPPDERQQRFRAEVGADQVFVPVRDLPALIGAMNHSIDEIIASGAVSGWIRPTDGLNDYVVELARSRSLMSVSSEDPDVLDMEYTGFRRIRNGASAVARLPFDWERINGLRNDASDDSLTVDWFSRPEGGDVTVSPTIKTSGGRFMVDIVFDPPMSPGETVEYSLRGDAPGYTHRWADDIREATRPSRPGMRDFGMRYFSSQRRVEELDFTVGIEVASGATPRGPRTGATRIIQSDPLPAGLAYSESEEIHRGRPYFLMHLHAAPALPTEAYRLTWNAPPRSRSDAHGDVGHTDEETAPLSP